MNSFLIIAASVVLGLGCQSASAVYIPAPAYTDSLGREWLSPNYARDRSWGEIESTCDYQSGACSGVLDIGGSGTRPHDLTGYVWATRDEVRDLVYEVTGLPSGELDDYQAGGPSNADMAWRFFEVFNSTMRLGAPNGFDHYVAGFTRDLIPIQSNGTTMIFGNWSYLRVSTDNTHTVRYTSNVQLSSVLPVNSREVSAGAFLYRPTRVSEPGTYALLGVGFLLLGIARRPHRRQKADAFRDIAAAMPGIGRSCADIAGRKSPR